MASLHAHAHTRDVLLLSVSFLMDERVSCYCVVCVCCGRVLVLLGAVEGVSFTLYIYGNQHSNKETVCCLERRRKVCAFVERVMSESEG